MHLSRHAVHALIIGAAVLIAAIAFAVPKKAGAQTSGYYTTTSTSTSSTDPVTGITTTSTTTNTPYSARSRASEDWRNARNSGSELNWRDRAARDEDPYPRDTSDMEARYPYDNTNGRNRSDVDAARSGFDDPRNPWDGRYANDHPGNYDASNSGSNRVVNSMRGNETSRNLGNDRYRPGNYGTRRIWRN